MHMVVMLVCCRSLRCILLTILRRTAVLQRSGLLDVVVQSGSAVCSTLHIFLQDKNRFGKDCFQHEAYFLLQDGNYFVRNSIWPCQATAHGGVRTDTDLVYVSGIMLILDTHSKYDNKGLEVAENHCSRFTCQQQAACSRDNANRRVNSACFPRREPCPC